ncbi:MAG: FMN-dependent NADH-azoreductase [Halocynthiibacter sp.]
MTRILQIDSSINGDHSKSRALTTAIVSKLGQEATQLDLATPLPAIDGGWAAANFTPKDDRTEAQRATLAQSDSLIHDLKAHDTLVIGIPVYNFSVPVGLKTWIDLIARVGETFHYTENGPVGHLTETRAILAFASGGTPAGSDYDFAARYMQQILGFVGITDITIITSDAEIETV